jgi:hypothetical protein
MKQYEVIRKSMHSKSDGESVKEYISLISQGVTVIWFDASGYSMLPLFWPGCRIRMNLCRERLEVGQVAVFPDGKKLVAHRLIRFDTDKGKWITKGDTLHFFDVPVDEQDIVGIVDFIDQKGKHLWVGADPAVAQLSAQLGRTLEDTLSWLPSIFKKAYYLSIFAPCFITIQMKKKFRSSAHK